MEEIEGYASEYEREVLDSNIRSEYDRSDARQFLQGVGSRCTLHFFVRFHLHADHIEVYGKPTACALEELDSSSEIDAEDLCDEYERVCREQFDYEPREPDRCRIRGAVKLHQKHDHLLEWVKKAVEDGGGLEPVYDELTGIKWIGRKIATFYIREAVWVWDVEDEVADCDCQYLHPIDRWVERVGEFLNSDLQDASDSEIAEWLAEACNEYSISNVRFNQGAFYAGAKKTGDCETLTTMLEDVGG